NKPAASPKLLAICGIGGIGKTHLVRRLIDDVNGEFEKVVWWSIDETKPPKELLRSLGDILLASHGSTIPLRRSARMTSKQSMAKHSAAKQSILEKSLEKSLDKKHKRQTIRLADEPTDVLIKRIVTALAKQRCLIVLDGFDTLFKSYSSSREEAKAIAVPQDMPHRVPTFHVNREHQASLYKPGLEVYGNLLTAIRESTGDSDPGQASCVILTSREKPREMLSFPSEDANGKLYTLDGLDDAEAVEMLQKFHLRGELKDYHALIARYYGHPMALRLAASTIKDVFYGSIQDFLEQEISVFDDLRSILKIQFNRLPPIEKEVMYWLAINHHACSLEGLQSDIVESDHKRNLLYTLQSLERRSLVQVKQPERSAGVSFQLHPIVAEYVLDRFIRSIFQDLMRGNLDLFNSYALMKADAEEDLRQWQIEMIVQPILERLKNYWKSLPQVDQYLSKKLDDFRETHPGQLGYAGGNFVNLLVQHSQGNLFRKNFSQLTIWQAYLQGAQLKGINFNNCELERSVFTETLSDVLAVALSPSSQWPLLAAGDANGFVHLWNTGRSEQSEGPFTSEEHPDSRRLKAGGKQSEWLAHRSWVRAIAFVPHQPLLVTGGDDSELKLWRLPTLQQTVSAQVEQVWQQPTGDWIHAVAVSPDGKIIASGGDDKITLYHAESGQQIDRLPRNPETNVLLDNEQPAGTQPTQLLDPARSGQHGRVRSLAFSPDGRWLASCGDDFNIRLWAMDSRSPETRECQLLEGHTDLVYSVRFSPDSKRLVSGGGDERIMLWQLAFSHVPDQMPDQISAQWQRLHTLERVGDRIRSLAISPQGHFLASGGDDAQVSLWDLNTLERVEEFSTQTSRIWSVDFQQQGERLMLSAGGDKQRLMLWQVSTEKESDPSANKTTHQSTETGELPSSLNHSTDQSVDQPAPRPIVRQIRTYRGYTNSLRAVAYLGDRRIVGGGDSGDLAVWDTETGDRKANLSLHHGRIWAIAVDSQNARIASASDDGTIRLWDATSGQCLTTLAGHSSWVRALSFSHHGRFLVSGGDDCTLRIWNPLSGFCLKILERASQWIRAVAFSPTNSRYVISGGDDQRVSLWDRKEGTQQSLAAHDHRICSVAYSPNGKLIASGSDDATVILWDVDRAEIIHRFTQPALGIKSVAFSPNGDYLAAGGEDQLIYVWDLTAQNPQQQCLELSSQEYTGLAGGIRSVAFSPDSRFVISAGLDEMIRRGDLRQMADLRERNESGEGMLLPLIQRDRPYENTKIEDIKGLSGLQLANLQSLGAVSRSKSLLL
ncbi:MAG: WD40 repeat domain-containing protein, partial [Phormidesmis sp.]